jgi:hypothetical protein
VSGGFKYADYFQVTPADSSYRSPPYAEAHHPCFIEIRYPFEYDQQKKNIDGTEIPDWMQESDFERKIVDEIIKLINVFCFSQFIQYEYEQAWFIDMDDIKDHKMYWGQKSYFTDNHKSKIEEFTSFERLIDTMNYKEYYNLNGKYFGADFAIPDILLQLISKYFSLNIEARQAYLIAITLFNSAKKIKSISPSISFTTFITCIESLVAHTYRNEIIEKCNTCGQKKYSVTKKFKNFMRDYNNNSKELVKYYEDAYIKRSDIIHSGKLFDGEIVPLSWSERDWDIFFFKMNIERVCRVALINWLIKTNENSPNNRFNLTTGTSPVAG